MWHKIDWTALTLLYKPNLKPMNNQTNLLEFVANEIVMLSTEELKMVAKAFLDEVKRRQKVSKSK